MHKLFKIMFWVLSAGVVACSQTQRHPDIASLYNHLAQHEDLNRNPIIVIPGMMGSRLIEAASGKVVWGAFGLGQVNPNTADGARLIALPIQTDTVPGSALNTVLPDGALDRYVVNFIGFPMELNAYANILSALGVGGYRDQEIGQSGFVDYGDRHFTCFQFDYDWRRDIVESAQALDRFIQEKTAYVKTEIRRRYGVDKKSVQFDIVAHSMGGLVARYYLRYGSDDLPSDGSLPTPTWEGAQNVGNLILIGTPNGGSLNSLVHLIDGYRPSPLLSRYPPAVLGTFPSLYQMLPRGRHNPLLNTAGQPVEDLFDANLWVQQKWGLSNPDETDVLKHLLPDVDNDAARLQIAMKYQKKALKRAEHFTRAMDLPAKAPETVRLMIVAGDAVQTKQTARISNKRGRLEIVEYAPGDGTVLRRSALMDERQGDTAVSRLISPIAWDQTLFLFSDHLGLTKDPTFTDNILHFLLEHPRPGY
jgi:pimeloyl-ACP methyl ester carboxylesterase